jgi:prepilin-type N-terminal cleavage/methylation domain-containing protein
MNSKHGFSLVELLIVMAIILIIAAIAIPNFLRSKMAANGASAAAALRTINTANTVYSALYHVGYAGSLAQLGPTSAACPTEGPGCAGLMDSLLSGIIPATPTPSKAGYRFTYYAPSAAPTASAPNSTWAAVAVPVIAGNTGTTTYCIDQRGSVWKDTSGNTTAADATGCTATWPPGGTVNPL